MIRYAFTRKGRRSKELLKMLAFVRKGRPEIKYFVRSGDFKATSRKYTYRRGQRPKEL